jgi:hypothetical protein
VKANRARLGSVPGDSPTWKIQAKPQGPTLAQFHRQRYQDLVRVLVGPLGSGKTFAAIMEVLAMCHEQTPDKQHRRRSRWCIARNTMPDLMSATIPDVRSIVDRINPDGWRMQAPLSWKHEYRRSDGTTVHIELLFRSFDGPQDVKAARGMQLSGVWVDELAEFHKENLDILIGRVKRYPAKAEVPKAQWGVIGTSNACARDHWLAEAAMGLKQDGWWIGVQPGGVIRKGNTWEENTHAENIRNLPDGYYRDQCVNKKESWIRQNLANEFVVHTDGRPVHPDFNEQLHVAPVAATPGIPIYVGIDFGRTPAAVILQRQVHGNWYVVRELVTQNMGADQFGKILRRLLNEEFSGYTIAEVTGDPAGSQMAQTRDETPFDLLAANGIDALPAHSNDFEERVATLDNQLTQLITGQPALLIDPECTTLIRGLAGEYQFRRLQVVGREEFRDKPDKGPTSHVVEALHYGLMGAGESDVLFEQSHEMDYDEIASWAQPDHIYE